MLQAERLERIRDYLVANKYASIAELADVFQTSPATISGIPSVPGSVNMKPI